MTKLIGLKLTKKVYSNCSTYQIPSRISPRALRSYVENANVAFSTSFTMVSPNVLVPTSISIGFNHSPK